MSWDARKIATGSLKVLTLSITAEARRRCHHVVLIDGEPSDGDGRSVLNRQPSRLFTAAFLMEKPPKKPPQPTPQPKAQHYGEDPRLKRRVANNLIGVDGLCLHLAGVGSLSP